MFIIFGWGHQTVKNHGPAHIYHCENCNNEKHWTLYTRRTWFTLFFIPLIPYSSEHLLLCPVCNYGVKLDAQQFNELKAIAECNMDLVNKKITQDEHTNRMNQLIPAQNNSSSIEENNMAGKTETQINYIKQMKEMEEKREREREEEEKEVLL